MTKCPPKNNCFNCGNAEHSNDPQEMIECLLYGWLFLKHVAEKSTCDKWESEEQ